MRQCLNQVLKLIILCSSFWVVAQGGFSPAQAMEGTKNNFLGLPDEIELEILSYIPREVRLQKVSLLSRRAYNLAMDTSFNPSFQITMDNLEDKLTKINSNSSQIEDKVSKDSLIQALLHPDFSRIDLYNIPPSLLPAISNALKLKPSLKTVCLSLRHDDSDKVEESSWLALVQLLQNSSLKTAYLIFKPRKTSIKKEVPIDTIETLGRLLAEHPITLKRLLVDFKCDSTGQRTTALLDGLEKNHTLTQLHLSKLFPLPTTFDMFQMPYKNAAIGQQGIERLVTYLAGHPNLQSCNLSSAKDQLIPQELLLKALEVVRKHPSLHNVGLRLDYDDEAVDTALTAVVKENNNLESLELIASPDSNKEKIFNLADFAKSLPLSPIKAYNQQGFKLTLAAFSNLLDGLHRSYLSVLQFGDLSFTHDELRQMILALELPISKIQQLILPFPTIQTDSHEIMEDIGTIALRSTSLVTLGFHLIEFDLASLRQHFEEQQATIFYNDCLQKFCESQHGPFHAIIEKWIVFIVEKKKIALFDETLDLIGEAFSTPKLAPRIPVLFSYLGEGDDVPAIADAWRGVGYFYANNFNAACQYFEKAFAKDSTLIDAKFYNIAAASHIAQDQWIDAIHMYQKYFEKVNPSDIEKKAYMGLGYAYFMDEKWVQAAECFEKEFRHEKGLYAEPDDLDYLSMAGRSYLKTGQLDKAAEYSEYMVKTFPDNVQAEDYACLGLFYYTQGRYQQSLEQYETAITKNQSISHDVYSAAAQVAISLQDWEKASSYLNKVIHLKNDLPVKIYERAAYANAKLWQVTDKRNASLLELTIIYLDNIAQHYQVSINELAVQELAAPLAEILEIAEIKEAVNQLNEQKDMPH